MNDMRSGIAMLAFLVALAPICIVAWGCSADNRISLQEFQQIEEETARQVSATQPADPPTQLKTEIDQALGPYKAGPGDVIHVVIVGLAQDTQFPPLDVRLDNNGDVEMPGVGKIHLAGLELQDVERVIRDAYVPKVYRQAVVNAMVLDANMVNVLVVGAVTSPGLVRLKRTECNLLYAMAGAGGAVESASGAVSLKRLRQPSQGVTLNLREPQGLQAALALAPLESGDIITVEAAIPNTIFVGGLVNAPRPQLYPQGVKMTVLQILAASGGLRTDVTPREATLIRRMPDGTDVQVKLNLDRLTTGRSPNLTLAAGDILWVPDTIETRVQDWINRNVFFRMGATVNAGYNANYNMSGVDYFNKAAKQQYGNVGQSGSLQDQYDPFGFLRQNQSLQTIQTQTTP
jgi:protein involved in polysaccharide export with SLBB domain